VKNRISTEGQLVLPKPKKPGSQQPKIMRDEVTGLPALSAGPDAHVLMSEEVREILASFP
jgi:hypothetical protein